MSKRQEEEAGYWGARRSELLDQMAGDEAELFAKLDGIYASEASKLERDIATYYQRYGEKNVIEYRRLLVQLSDEDRRMLIERMDDFSRKYPQYAHLMPIRESIYKLNEMEGIQAAIRIQQLEIGAIEQDLFNEHFAQQALRGANLAGEQMGFGQNFYTVNASVVAETVGAAWAVGGAYSERIWANREKLAAYLNDDFAKSIARGVAYDKLTKTLTERFVGVSARDAKRLVYTEGTFLFNEAQAQVHESDFEGYRLSCVHDSKTCPVCKELEAAQEKKPVKFSERKPGVNFPPLHPWCRCSYEVAVDDWDAWIDAYVAKRGGDASRPRSYSDVVTYENGSVVRYEKPEDELEEHEKAGISHLANNGISLTVLEEIPDAPANIDLGIDGVYWEMKNVTNKGSSVYNQLKRARTQWRKRYGDSGYTKVVFTTEKATDDYSAIVDSVRARLHEDESAMVISENGKITWI